MGYQAITELFAFMGSRSMTKGNNVGRHLWSSSQSADS